VTTSIDTEHILAGERFEEKIVAAMNQAKANVIFCGPQGLGRWQAVEVPFASKLDTEKKIRAIVVLLPNTDEAKVSQDIGLLATKSYIIFKTEEDETALENLRRSLQAVMGAGAASETPSSPVEDGGAQTDSSHPSTPNSPKAMTDSQTLLNYLKSLLPGQFSEVIFRLDIDESILSMNVGQAQKAIEVIRLLKQSPDGLTRLEAVLKDILKLRKLDVSPPNSPSTSSSSSFPLKLLLGVPLVMFIIIFIGAKIFPQDASPSHQSTPSNSTESKTRDNTDYLLLKQALESVELEKADKITTEILLKEAVKETDSKRLENLLNIAKNNPEEIELSDEEIEQISCTALRQLNQLWESNSKGLFGFRKQNDIWNSINHNDRQHWDKFASRVGWMIINDNKDNKWASRENNFFIEKEGHLPSFIYVSPKGETGNKQPRIDWNQFFKHIQNCKL
jgi:hypothetical protein